MGNSEWWRSLRLLGLFMAISLATRWLSLVLDVIDIDEASHAVGARVLLQGGLLYTDFVDNKPPLLYAAFALAQLVGGRGLAGVHLVTAAIVIPLTALAVSACYRHRRTGVVAAITLIVYGAAFIGHDMLATNAELLMVLPASWAVMHLRDTQRAASDIRILTAGLLFGTAALVKPQVATWAVAATVAIAHLHASRGELRRAVRAVALLAAAMAAPAGLVFAYFAARGGAEALIYWMGGQNLWYAGNPISPREALERWLSYFVPSASPPRRCGGGGGGAGRASRSRTGSSSHRRWSSRHCLRCSSASASFRTTSSSCTCHSSWRPPRGWTRWSGGRSRAPAVRSSSGRS